MQIRSYRRRTTAFVLFVVFLFPFTGSAAPLEIGSIPPDAIGKAYKGDEILISDGAGRITIVTFWATWCGPCMKELPVLNAIQKRGGADRIRVIAINLEEPRQQFRRAMRAFDDYVIEFVHDEKGRVAKKYGVKGIPNMLIIDTDGRIAYQHVGYNESALEGIVAEINSLLIANEMLEEEAESQ